MEESELIGIKNSIYPLQQGLSELGNRVDKLEKKPAPVFDFSALQASIKDLTDRVKILEKEPTINDYKFWTKEQERLTKEFYQEHKDELVTWLKERNDRVIFMGVAVENGQLTEKYKRFLQISFDGLFK